MIGVIAILQKEIQQTKNCFQAQQSNTTNPNSSQHWSSVNFLVYNRLQCLGEPNGKLIDTLVEDPSLQIHVWRRWIPIVCAIIIPQKSQKQESRKRPMKHMRNRMTAATVSEHLLKQDEAGLGCYEHNDCILWPNMTSVQCLSKSNTQGLRWKRVP